MTIDYYTQERAEVAAIVPKGIKTILDIGCGRGAFLKTVKRETSAETWGVEKISEIANEAKQNADKIVIGKIEEIYHHIPDNYFECITLNDVLEHMLEPVEILKLLRPKLTRNGIIIASIPNVRYVVTLFDLIIKKDWEYKDAGILDKTHFRFFTKKSMNRIFEESGFKINTQVGINKINFKLFELFNLITFFYFNDTKFRQFVCVASNATK